MTRINIRNEFGLTKVYDADGEIIATFTGHPLAENLYACMEAGLATSAQFTVYDLDAQHVRVGDVGELAA